MSGIREKSFWLRDTEGPLVFSFDPLVVTLSFNVFDILAAITLQLATNDYGCIYNAGPSGFHARACYTGTLQVLS